MRGARYIKRSPRGLGPWTLKPKRKIRLRWICALVFFFVVTAYYQKETSCPVTPQQHSQGPSCYEVGRTTPPPSARKSKIKQYVVQAGDTLYEIFQNLHLSVECLAECSGSCPEFTKLNHLQPEDELVVHVDRLDQEPFKLVYSSVDGSTYTFSKAGAEWKCEENNPAPVTNYRIARGVITDTLYDSCIRGQLPPALVMDLAELFEHEIDFNSEVQEGDTFAVYFEERLRNGKKIHSGPIVAAEMVISGERHLAFHYELPDGFKGYFNEEGESLRTLFIKAPLRYSRISSTFTNKRFHPILRTFRPHFGIDYAAPRGTPVSALGSGTVTFLGRRGGFGRYIEIRHNATYKTAYGHLSAFKKHLREGTKVAQGDVIGYVGASGLATGPHLDFRFYKNGKPTNFLKSEFPRARSVPRSVHQDFTGKIQTYMAALHGEGHFAENEGAVLVRSRCTAKQSQ